MKYNDILDKEKDTVKQLKLLCLDVCWREKCFHGALRKEKNK